MVRFLPPHEANGMGRWRGLGKDEQGIKDSIGVDRSFKTALLTPLSLTISSIYIQTEASKGDVPDQIKSRQDALENDVVNGGTKKRREGEDCESILGRPSRNSCKVVSSSSHKKKRGFGTHHIKRLEILQAAADCCYADVVHQQLNPRLETIWYTALDCMVK
ncbi:uncharacterized protein LOC135596829 [Musa acuminata AAA Group]|uniref:uncharacterized protein LOC135596829 n=1 Tax=Musa acuminata AAA Group TaxID=214697 RepID=UPI0031DEDA24